jgi:hypothetical protein
LITDLLYIYILPLEIQLSRFNPTPIYACPEIGTEFLYIYVLPLEIQLSRFNPTPIYACPELGTEFLLAYVVVIFVINDLRWLYVLLILLTVTV